MITVEVLQLYYKNILRLNQPFPKDSVMIASRVRAFIASFKNVEFNRELKIGDILTVTTILVSLVTVVVSWNVDRGMRSTRDADEIRAAAVVALGELERWQTIPLSVYANTQGLFVEVGEMITAVDKVPARNKVVIEARDKAWKRINDLYVIIDKKILDERIESGYSKLFTYFPNIREIYLNTIFAFHSVDLEMRREFLIGTERAILDFRNRKAEEPIQSAEVGSALRRVASELQTKYAARFSAERLTTEKYLLDKITANDDALLKKSRDAKLR